MDIRTFVWTRLVLARDLCERERERERESQWSRVGFLPRFFLFCYCPTMSHDEKLPDVTEALSGIQKNLDAVCQWMQQQGHGSSTATFASDLEILKHMEVTTLSHSPLFSVLFDVAVHPSGFLVSDSGKNCIWIMDMTSRKVSLWAGKPGTKGKVDSTMKESTFNTPQGLCVLSDGCVLVCDYSNHLIRKIFPEKDKVETFAGCGNRGFADGPFLDASFQYPPFLCQGEDGDIFVSDCGNRRIRKLSPKGQVSVAAGQNSSSSVTKDGPLDVATFCSPTQLVFTHESVLYIADCTQKGNQSATLVRRLQDEKVTSLEVHPSAGSKYGLAISHSKQMLFVSTGRNIAVVPLENENFPSKEKVQLAFCPAIEGIAADGKYSTASAKDIRGMHYDELKETLYFVEPNAIRQLAFPTPVLPRQPLPEGTGNLSLLIGSGTPRDVIFVAEGEEIHSIRAALSARCKSLHALTLKDDATKITLENTSAKAFKAFHDYLFTDKFPLDQCSDFLDEVFVLSHRFEVNELKDFCQKYLIAKLSKQNALHLLQLSFENEAPELKKSVTKFILHRLSSFQKDGSLSKLRPDLLVDVVMHIDRCGYTQANDQ